MTNINIKIVAVEMMDSMVATVKLPIVMIDISPLCANTSDEFVVCCTMVCVGSVFVCGSVVLRVCLMFSFVFEFEEVGERDVVSLLLAFIVKAGVVTTGVVGTVVVAVIVVGIGFVVIVGVVVVIGVVCVGFVVVVGVGFV